MFVNMLVPFKTSSKVAAGPLASGDPQVTLSLWRCTHLMDHELIGNPKPNPQRVPHIHYKMEILQATSSST
jgi:hypothetical protein